MLTPTKALISIAALRNNFSIIDKKVRSQGADSKNIICVVKADAYGHGAVNISSELIKLGVTRLAVSCFLEALELRENNINCEIVIFGPLQYIDVNVASEKKFTVCVSCPEDINLLKSLKTNNIIKVIVNVDTGMGRMGITLEESINAFNELKEIKCVKVIGIMSHLSCADKTEEEDIKYTKNQINDFKLLAEIAKKSFNNLELISFANSSGILFQDGSIFGAPRPGIALYGVSPDNNTDNMDGFEPVMNVVTQIAQIRDLPEGTCISYGRESKLERDSKIALIPIGYEDGMQRKIKPGFNLMVHDTFVPIVGSITMDYTLLDITDIKDAKVGDEVLVMGKKGKSEVRAEKHAEAAGTISYEILTSIGKRVIRQVVDK